MRHPCPACWINRRATLPGQLRRECELCGWRGYLEIPLDEPGLPQPPSHPARLRAFIYGMAQGLAAMEAGEKRTERPHDPRLGP